MADFIWLVAERRDLLCKQDDFRSQPDRILLNYEKRWEKKGKAGYTDCVLREQDDTSVTRDTWPPELPSTSTRDVLLPWGLLQAEQEDARPQEPGSHPPLAHLSCSFFWPKLPF